MQIEPIGVIHSCFTHPFAIPRQAGLCPHAKAILCLDKEKITAQALAGLENFSHLWIIFGFHQLKSQRLKQKVRPPRLGGEKTLGFLASRAPYRPNPIGLSAVGIEKIVADELKITVTGGDFLHLTPIYDIKPYLPYADALPQATSLGFDIPPKLPVHSTAEARKAAGDQMDLILEALSLDPRPATQKQSKSDKEYKTKIANLDIIWCYKEGAIYWLETR